MVRGLGTRLTRAWHRLRRAPPPGPFRAEFWSSPLRGPWLTAVLSIVLLVGFVLVTATGLLSYAAYNPDLKGGFTDLTPNKGFLGFYLFPWPTRPVWVYWLNQGIHVIGGLVLIPVLLAKLWSVMPRLFAWPPAASVAKALERGSLFLLVGATMFEIVTGVANIQYFYVFPGSFYRLHFYGAWVFIAALVVHTIIKLPQLVVGLRGRSLRRELRARTAEPEPRAVSDLVSPQPAEPTISRRGALGLVGAGSAAMLIATAGQSVGGWTRHLAVLAPRGRVLGDDPNDFQVNKTAEFRGITTEMAGPGWRLEVRGGRTTRLSRAELLAMPQHTADLPIACVEGWSTGVQRWSGVRLADLARLVGASESPSVLVESLQPVGGFRSAALRGNQFSDPLALLALRVNDADLSLDHGYPARVIVPAAPGVHNTKWVSTVTFRSGGSAA